MVLSRRERYIVAATVGVLALALANHFVLGPLLDRRSEISAERDTMSARLEQAQSLLSRRGQVEPLWNAMRQSLRSSPAEAESQIQHAVLDAAEEAGLALSLLKSERPADKTRLPQIAFQAAGTGSMRAVSRFLWRLETAQVPVRISELQLGSRKEGTDDLSVQLRLSTLCLPAEFAPSASPKAAEKSE